MIELPNNLSVPVLIGDWVDAALASSVPLWLLDGFVPAQSLVVVSGRPKLSKKTWFSYLAAMSMSSGQPVGPFRPANAVGVLYINKEGADQATAHRFKALCAGHGMSLAGMQLHFMQRAGFFLDEPRHLKEMCAYITAHNIKCVFIDTFAKCFRGDENNARDVGAALRGVEKFRDAGSSVVLVHHIKKAKVELIGGIPDPDAGLRGSSALAGAYDNIISIQDLEIDGNLETWAVVGGKYLDFAGYQQEWTIKQDAEKNANFAKLVFDGPQALPVVDDTNKKGSRYDK